MTRDELKITPDVCCDGARCATEVGAGGASGEQTGTPPETASDEQVGSLVALGRALSDPIRVRMLHMLAIGRGCCDLPRMDDVPIDGEDDCEGICVCEFTAQYGLGQSKVSYHLGKLKEAGLVREERRGKWSFYSIDRGTVDRVLGLLAAHLATSG